MVEQKRGKDGWNGQVKLTLAKVCLYAGKQACLGVGVPELGAWVDPLPECHRLVHRKVFITSPWGSVYEGPTHANVGANSANSTCLKPGNYNIFKNNFQANYACLVMGLPGNESGILRRVPWADVCFDTWPESIKKELMYHCSVCEDLGGHIISTRCPTRCHFGPYSRACNP